MHKPQGDGSIDPGEHPFHLLKGMDAGLQRTDERTAGEQQQLVTIIQRQNWIVEGNQRAGLIFFCPGAKQLQHPMPEPERMNRRPEAVPLSKKPIKATHYGRNIESIIDLIAEKEEGDVKNSMIRSLAIYMRQQYLIWNKDTVSDETIFQDIEKLSDYRIRIPEGLQLGRVDSGFNSARPGINPAKAGKNQNRQRNNQKNFRKK